MMASRKMSAWASVVDNAFIRKGQRILKNRFVQAFLLSLVFVIIMIFTYKDYGVTWDEPTYFGKGHAEMTWILHPQMSTIDDSWYVTDEHPPLTKELIGLAGYIFHDRLHITNAVVGFRLGTTVLVFSVTFFMYLFIRKRYGTFVAFFTSTAFFFLPRVFFEAHLGALDYGVTVWTFLAISSFINAIDDWRWMFPTSVFLGFALLSKLQGFFVYIFFGIYWLVTVTQLVIFYFRTRRPIWKRLGKFFLMYIAPLIVLPPIIVLALWPYLWPEPIARFITYLQILSVRFPVGVYYLGHYYTVAPWHYPFVMTLVTIPGLILVLFGVGLFSTFQRPKKWEPLLVLAAFMPLIIMASPQAYKYDGVRLLLPSYPFLCAVAGIGLSRIISWGRTFRISNLFIMLSLIGLIVTVYTGIVHTHPYQSSYFNEFVGGVDGAAKMGFETEYWGNAYIGILPWMNAHPDINYCIYPLTQAFDEDKAIGLLSPTISYEDYHSGCSYLILLSRQGSFFYLPAFWPIVKNDVPLYSVNLDHTPLVRVYKLSLGQ